MSHSQRQFFAAFCLLSLAAVCGLWLGEHQAGPLPVRDLVVAAAIAAIAAIAASALWRGGRAMAVATRDASGHRLAFSDWLVQHEASESRPFEADK